VRRSSRNKATTVRASVTFDSEHHQRLLKLAEEKRVSFAWVVRDAVERYLKSAHHAEQRENRGAE
jgi:predicted transcriptional regulator